MISFSVMSARFAHGHYHVEHSSEVTWQHAVSASIVLYAIAGLRVRISLVVQWPERSRTTPRRYLRIGGAGLLTRRSVWGTVLSARFKSRRKNSSVLWWTPELFQSYVGSSDDGPQAAREQLFGPLLHFWIPLCQWSLLVPVALLLVEVGQCQDCALCSGRPGNL